MLWVDRERALDNGNTYDNAGYCQSIQHSYLVIDKNSKSN